jgi:hypothetical protein
LQCSENEDDGEDEEDDALTTELWTLSYDDEPSWVMDTMSKMAQQHMDSITQKQK